MVRETSDSVESRQSGSISISCSLSVDHFLAESVRSILCQCVRSGPSSYIGVRVSVGVCSYSSTANFLSEQIRHPGSCVLGKIQSIDIGS